jgi:addiction module RelE/StbE family toxin
LTPSALQDVQAAGEFIAMAEREEEAARLLKTDHALGRPGRLRGTREMVISGTPLLVVYRVRVDIIAVLRVLHHARKWP